ncbi:hypothetical protein [Bradyrhizobium sp. 23]|uniref:hypothetical protein n=1 Tax=Bradyrhizobium sp. 23 TaxID=2782667 RepID=UPI001FFA249E|nr:hypothetical protein [Bradyrhizobium sp. 23]MCK1317142.1 hypothetical protein [Bradyrhizobium sp. 23]
MGEAIAKTFFDEFEAAGNHAPTRDELAALRERWNEHLAAQHLPWGKGDPYSNQMIEAANNHFDGRVKFHTKHRSTGGASVHGQGAEGHGDPRTNAERGWSGSAGISRHDSSRPTDD